MLEERSQEDFQKSENKSNIVDKSVDKSYEKRDDVITRYKTIIVACTLVLICFVAASVQHGYVNNVVVATAFWAFFVTMLCAVSARSKFYV